MDEKICWESSTAIINSLHCKYGWESVSTDCQNHFNLHVNMFEGKNYFILFILVSQSL